MKVNKKRILCTLIAFLFLLTASMPILGTECTEANLESCTENSVQITTEQEVEATAEARWAGPRPSAPRNIYNLNLVSNLAHFTWSPPSTGQATGYQIELLNEWHETRIINVVGTTQHRAENLTSNLRHFVRIRAHNAAGQYGPWSCWYQFTTPQARVQITWNANGGHVNPTSQIRWCGQRFGTLPVPTHPRGYTFLGWFSNQTGGFRISETWTVPRTDTTYWARWDVPALQAPTLRITAQGATHVTLTWNSVSGATRYRLYRTTTNGTFLSADITGTTHHVAGLNFDTTHTFHVVSINSAGQRSPNSNAVVFNTATNPTNMSITAPAVSRTETWRNGLQIPIRGSVSNAIRLEAWVNGVRVHQETRATNGTLNMNFIFNVPSAGRYRVQLRAYSSDGLRTTSGTERLVLVGVQDRARHLTHWYVPNINGAISVGLNPITCPNVPAEDRQEWMNNIARGINYINSSNANVTINSHPGTGARNNFVVENRTGSYWGIVSVPRSGSTTTSFRAALNSRLIMNRPLEVRYNYVTSVTVHEFGHVFGLGDDPTEATRPDGSIMHTGTGRDRNLTFRLLDFDIVSINMLYPN